MNRLGATFMLLFVITDPETTRGGAPMGSYKGIYTVDAPSGARGTASVSDGGDFNLQWTYNGISRTAIGSLSRRPELHDNVYICSGVETSFYPPTGASSSSPGEFAVIFTREENKDRVGVALTSSTPLSLSRTESSAASPRIARPKRESVPLGPESGIERILSEGEKRIRVSEWDSIARQLKTAPGDAFTSQVIKAIFGEAVKNAYGTFGLVTEAIDPTMAADATLSGTVQKWVRQCEKVLGEEDARDEKIRYLLDQEKSFVRRLQTERLSRDEVNMLSQAIAQADSIVDTELKIVKYRMPARAWCHSFLPHAKAFLNPNGQDESSVTIP